MTKDNYMALADFQTLWNNPIKPSLPALAASPAVGMCLTAANVAAKVVTVDRAGFQLKAGLVIAVKFVYGNTVSDGTMTLNVNGTGGKQVSFRAEFQKDGQGVAYYLMQQDPALIQNKVGLFIYDYGYNTYIFLGYQRGSASLLSAGTDSDLRLWSAQVLTAFFASKTALTEGLADKADSTHTHKKADISDFDHDHDSRYYTEAEVDAKLDALIGPTYDEDEQEIVFPVTSKTTYDGDEEEIVIQ